MSEAANPSPVSSGEAANHWCVFLALSTASETGSDYHPIFFNQDRLLEELFCVCIQLLNKTWKEMRATQEDFDKVSNMSGGRNVQWFSGGNTNNSMFNSSRCGFICL